MLTAHAVVLSPQRTQSLYDSDAVQEEAAIEGAEEMQGFFHTVSISQGPVLEA